MGKGYKHQGIGFQVSQTHLRADFYASPGRDLQYISYWTSIRLDIALFIIPFFIAWDPALLGIGSPLNMAVAVITGLIGAALMEAGFEGWLLRQANWPERVLLVIAGILLMIPE